MAEGSVYNLLNKLCDKVYEKDLPFPRRWQPHELELQKRQRTLRRLRTKCFEILLRKTCVHGASKDLEEEIMFEVAYRVPELNWERRCEEAEHMSWLVKGILDKELHKDDHFSSILELLVRLKDSEPYKEDLEPKTFRYEALKPHDPSVGPRPYTILPLNTFDPPAWMEQLDVPRVRGYLPEGGSFPFDSEPGHDLPLMGQFITPVTLDGTWSRVPIFQTPLVPELQDQRGLQVPKLVLPHHEVDEGYEEGSRIVSPCSGTQQQKEQVSYRLDLSIWEEALHFEMPRLRTWERLGRRIVPKERPFLSEAGEETVDHLWKILRLPRGLSGAGGAQDSALEGSTLLAHPLLHEELVRDLIHLLMGVPSHSFPYNEDAKEFLVAPGLCMKGLSPEALSSICQAFLEAGTCCRRLQDFSSSSCPRLLDQLQGKGLVMQALQDHVRIFLQFHRGASLLLPSDRPLLSLHNWAEGLMTKIVAMAQLCCVAPLQDPSPCLPAGMALVAYLYERLSNEARPDVCCIIYSTLQACARVYLRFLQRWIFEGVIHDTCGEFFVQPVVTVPGMAHTRKEWSQRYQLVQGAVPRFLRGLEQDILLCGKTVQLLKLCCPKAPLCIALESGYPAMPCCLHGHDVRQLATACTEFEERVRKLVGTPPVNSAADLWPKRRLSAEQALQATIQQARQQNLLKNKLEQEAGRQAVAARQQQWRQELQEQAQAAQVQRREMHDQELQQERQLQAFWQKQQEEEDQRKEEEKQRLVEYYEELSEIVDKRKRHAEWRMERMRLNDQREEFLLSDRREWKALAELNQKNLERGGVRPPTALEVIEEDVAQPLLPLHQDPAAPAPVARTDIGDLGILVQDEQVTNANNNQLTPNNNENHNLNDNNNFHREIPNLLDTTNEDIALGNIISLQPDTVGDSKVSSFASTGKSATTAETDQATGPGTQPRHVRSAVDGNRQKVLEEEFGIAQKKAQRPKTVPLYQTHKSEQVKEGSTFEEWNDNVNQRQRNRWNMLHGDINIVTGAAKVATSEGAEEVDASGDDRHAMSSLATGGAQETNTVESSPVTSSEPASQGDVVGNIVSPDEERMSVTKSDSSNSVNVFKSASAFSSKTNSSYNIASLTSSSSFDLGSGKFTLSTPTSTDGSVDAFKSCVSGTSSSNSSNNINHNNNINSSSMGGSGASDTNSNAISKTQKAAQTSGFVPFWKSMRLSCLSEESKVDNGAIDRKDQAGDKLDKIEELSDDFTLVNVALQKSIAIPLHMQLRLANEAVLKFFFEELDLHGHCLSLRSYFLMTDGEYSHTMTCDLFRKMATVSQPSDLLNIVCLNELLRKALSASLGGKEENSERLSFKVQFTPERFTMTSVDVLRCLSLRYHVEWPLNIIFTESALTKYNDIFGFLLKVRLVSWALEDAFHKLKEMGERMFEQPGRRRLVQLWRHEMMHFVHAVQGYIMSTALQTSWAEFEKNLAQAHTLDKIYSIHVNYVKRILQRCLLSKQFQQMLSILLEIFNIMLRFHEQLLAKPMADSQVFHKLGRLHHKYRKVTSLFYTLLSKLVSTNCMPYLHELFEVLSVNNHYASLSSSSVSASSSTS